LDNKNLKKAGLKVTLPRVKILQILENANEHHLSAEDVYRILLESGDDIGLATVYRVLTQFEEAKLVIRHNFAEGHSVFELDNGTHHNHLICIKCNRVKEFIDNTLEQRQRKIAESAGFTIVEHSLNIFGICDHCHQSNLHLK